MAKNSVRDFDATAANNTDIQSVDIAENCAPSGINNAIRELMADIKNVSTGTIALESPSADSLTVTGDLTVDTNTLYVDSTNNRVGVGTTSPTQVMTVKTATDANFIMLNDSGVRLQATNDAGTSLDTLKVAGSPLIFLGSGGAETARIDSSGNVGIGTSSPDGKIHAYSGDAIQTAHPNANQLVAENSGNAGLSILSGSTSTGNIYFGDSGDGLDGYIQYKHGDNYLRFGTVSTERMRIRSDGDVLIGKSSSSFGTNGLELSSSLDANGWAAWFTATPTANGGVIAVNRLSTDGKLIEFYQGGTAEGGITVSGTTVSYNGGHLSRWSQLTDGTKDTSIVKGTVMTNLDQMAVWSHNAVEAQPAVYDDDGNFVSDAVEAKDAFTEDNEQLNCMAISSVEGDTNVAGVFVNWDADDNFNDMNVAMTGDMVIRIAQGITIARGDLLMSAGDGTAKPQGDDIVRSKTIAKVTSTNVSHTYDDGSYLVPCVLMAC
jgi:roadblock/LC7 domain-containing protein